MNMFRRVFVNFPVILLLYLIVINASAEELQVYKGELRIVMSDQHERNTLLLQYRTKTREVLRIGITGLTLTNAVSKDTVRFDDRSASLVSRIGDGYWNTEIVYDDLNLTDDDYRVEGNIVFYLAGSQQSRNFSVYTKPGSNKAPYGSSIDWGISH